MKADVKRSLQIAGWVSQRNPVNINLALAAILMLTVICAGTIILKNTRPAKAEAATIEHKYERARLSDSISVEAAGRGKPYVNLSDGRDMITGYDGPAELVEALEQNRAKPLSLASADFDEDGVPDLVSGYGFAGGGIISVHRGSLDSLYPTAPAEQRLPERRFAQAPFLSPAMAIRVPEAPDFMGAGDFDGDGHRDVVVAARGGNHLHLLSGDGRGEFSEARRVELDGGVTYLVVGEVNRRDGLDDVVVAVNGAKGPKVLVFEGPEGALKSYPEAISMPDEVTSLSIGRIYDEYTCDLVAAAGRRLMVVRGRDRKLSLDQIARSEVPQAEVSSRLYRTKLQSVVTGDFTGGHETDIAVLSEEGIVEVLSQPHGEGRRTRLRIGGWGSKPLAGARWDKRSSLIRTRTACLPFDSLLIIDPTGNHLGIVTAKGGGSEEARQGLELAGSAVVMESGRAEDGPVAAIPMDLNHDALSDLVFLQRDRTSVAVAMTQPQAIFFVTTTNDSGNGSLRQAIIDANLNPGADEIRFNIAGAGPHTISPTTALPTIQQAVTIDGYSQPDSSQNTLATGNNADLRIVLSGANAGGANGLTITGGSSTVQGLVINNFDHGLHLETNGNNVIKGNFIGTDTAGAADLGNNQGIRIQSSSGNKIGEPTAAARNLFSGNGAGIWVEGAGATGNQIRNNYIGTDRNGTTGLGNTDGVVLNSGAQNNTVGEATTAGRNVISGNADDDGILIAESGNLVQGNYIGPNASGNSLTGQQRRGMRVLNSSNNTIGGTTSSARNIISGNTSGITLGSTGHQVQGNYIGLTASGGAALPNTNGVEVFFSSGNNIGGATPSARNIISGNTSAGIKTFSNASGAVIQGNYIGTNPAGTTPRPNGTGISIDSSNNTIGGASGAGNLISGNGLGIDISFDSTENLVQGNLIGTAADGASSLGNSGSGVFVSGSGNVIGARLNPDNTFSGPGNKIAFNGGNGITGGLDSENTFFSNLIFSNAGGLQIEVFPPGITTVRPTITSATVMNNTITIIGFLDGDPDTDYWLDFYFSNPPCQSPNGGGEQSLTALPLLRTTDANGRIDFNIQLAFTFGSGFVNCHSTRAGTNGGEFSDCFAVSVCTPPSVSMQPTNQTTCAGSMASFTVSAAGTDLTYQWRKNQTPLSDGGNISGADTAMLTINPANTGDAGSYDVVVSGSCNPPATSSPATLTVEAPPSITSHPEDESGCEGGSAMFTSAASSTSSFSVKWQVSTDGGSSFSDVPGATGASLTLAMLSASQNGNRYRAVFTNQCGSSTTSAATLTVNVYSLSANSLSFPGNGGIGSVNVSAAAGCSWSALVTEGSDFITITEGSTGSGDGTVRYSVGVNTGTMIRSGTLIIANKSYQVIQGINFNDVPSNHIFYTEIGKLSARQVTLGCDAANYCPDLTVTRQQMAAFIIRALGDFNPPQPAMQRFVDVPPGNPFYAFIEQMAVRQITLGCTANMYCPGDPVLRDQMAAFIIRALHPPGYIPPQPAMQRFVDVPPSNAFYAHIDEMAVREITLGCGAGIYCPTLEVSRGQMAAFLVRAFNL